MRADTIMGDEIKIKEDLLAQAQVKKESEAAKTRVEKKAKKKYEILEEEGILNEEDKALLDEVNEEKISEISLEPNEKAEKSKKKI